MASLCAKKPDSAVHACQFFSSLRNTKSTIVSLVSTQVPMTTSSSHLPSTNCLPAFVPYSAAVWLPKTHRFSRSVTSFSIRRTSRRGSREIQLTKTEFDLLEALMLRSGLVVSREQLYEEIWGYDFETGSKSLDVYIGYLRRKTEEAGESRIVFTVRGVGYTVKA